MKKVFVLLVVLSVLIGFISCDLLGLGGSDSSSSGGSSSPDYDKIIIFENGSTIDFGSSGSTTKSLTKGFTAGTQTESHSIAMSVDELDWYASTSAKLASNRGQAIDFRKLTLDENGNHVIEGDFYNGDAWNFDFYGCPKGKTGITKANVSNSALVDGSSSYSVDRKAEIPSINTKATKILNAGVKGNIVVNMTYKSQGSDVFYDADKVSAKFLIGDNIWKTKDGEKHIINGTFDGSYDFDIGQFEVSEGKRTIKLVELNISSKVVKYGTISLKDIDISLDDFVAYENVQTIIHLNLLHTNGDYYCEHDFSEYAKVDENTHVTVCSKCGAVKEDSEADHVERSSNSKGKLLCIAKSHKMLLRALSGCLAIMS